MTATWIAANALSATEHGRQPPPRPGGKHRRNGDQGDELPAAVELRRLLPGITDSDQARPLARTIAGWKTCQ